MVDKSISEGNDITLTESENLKTESLKSKLLGMIRNPMVLIQAIAGSIGASHKGLVGSDSDSLDGDDLNEDDDSPMQYSHAV